MLDITATLEVLAEKYVKYLNLMSEAGRNNAPEYAAYSVISYAIGEQVQRLRLLQVATEVEAE
jgi:hypothetical protein